MKFRVFCFCSLIVALLAPPQLQTPNYVQVTGVGDFTTIGVPEGDPGGEMDSAGADDLGNPIGGVFYTTANPASNGEPAQVRHWTNFSE